ncbi:MAG: UDP-N-acetylmuramoyl-L-alanyl-D-glutamate--2,6-diaminopimelate ligase [Oscillospiraceae bacterium]|jgi:UDP-N-acetylmuramoyl-L-alanyl-D-glutamate--2,6-diaminopimelate ligase|nr:UDP-N-acetylmuramoyl-L-alanyl-D-glutamate--2,6-diaminopimelate ligase [Oscillospiraceae bacterium]
MKLVELLAEITPVSLGADPGLEVKGLCLDSRRVSVGDLFFAVPGTHEDGAAYIPQALAAGAAAVVTETETDTATPSVRVSDLRAAMAAMAARFYGYPAARLRMIGVTGTNGKTTVTHIVKGILERAGGFRVGLIGTNGNWIGDTPLPSEHTTPDILTLQALLSGMAEAGCTHCVMEVSSHALSQRRVDGVEFREALFTNLTQDHMDYHRDMEAYFRAKALLFQQSDAAVLNLDDPHGQRLAEDSALNSITYSTQRDEADVVAKNIRFKANRVEFEVVTTSGIARIEWATPGLFSVYNALAAVACALMEGVALRDIAAATREIPPVRGRMEVVPGPEGVTVVIDYAHTPDALENLLSAVGAYHSGRVITLFGCGGDRDRGKRPLMGAAAARLSDLVIVTSDNPRTEPPAQIIEEIMAGVPTTGAPVLVVENRVEAIGRALAEAKSGDAVLLAGKGHEDYQEINGQKFPLDEREVVADWVRQTQEQEG